MPRIFSGLILHAGGVDPTGWLWSDWNVEPTIAVGLLALLTAYLYLTRQPAPPPPGTSSETAASDRVVSGRQRGYFIAGVVTLFVALGPPLDDWSDHYLLLAHMVQHLLLFMLAAPLLLLGTPAWLLEPLARNRVTNTVGYWLTRPVVAFAIANAVFVIWHITIFYEAALRSQPLHVLEHATMFGAGLIAWWPILGPLPAWPRLALPLHSLYLFAMTIPGSAIGAFITFADPGLYAPYDTARRIFGIDLATDQQAAGLLMWVGVTSIYLVLITNSFFRWAKREEAAETSADAVARARRTVEQVQTDPRAHVPS